MIRKQTKYMRLYRIRKAVEQGVFYQPRFSKRSCDMCEKPFMPVGNPGNVLRCSRRCRKIAGRIRARRANQSKAGVARARRFEKGTKRAAYRKKYRHENRDRLKAYNKNRAAINPEIRLQAVLHTTLAARVGLSSRKTEKSKYMDYSVKELRRHLEKLFLPGMSWSNYGKKGWHIDHIRALSTFVFFTKTGNIRVKEIKKAMALSNLQPLWAKENLRKGNRTMADFAILLKED